MSVMGQENPVVFFFIYALSLSGLFVSIIHLVLVVREVAWKLSKGATVKIHRHKSMRVSSKQFTPAEMCEKNCLLTPLEKQSYYVMSSIAMEYGYTVFVKVPLCCVLQLKHGAPNYSNSLAQLSTTYLDFVLCDPHLSVRFVIKLEPSKMSLENSASRDFRVDTALRANGVDVLHTMQIDETTREWFEHRIWNDT